MEFPHLSDTKFPNAEGVNVYSYRNDFDYERWVPGTKLKLVNVLWNGDYEDVVKFDTDDARDNWFDQLATDPRCSVVLNTNVRVETGTVKVPIPFDIATQYNYLVVETPIATSADNPIAYETADGIRRWHFFVSDWQSTAPSTTILTINLDVWTQYANSVGIGYMTLERGHAPVAVSDTDAYLANPLDESEYLLAPDVDFGGETVARGGAFIPFGNGEKYVCMASTCPTSLLGTLGTASDSGGSFSDPTFRDASDYPDSTNRWGHQYEVDGYAWGAGGRSYSGLSTPAGNPITSDGHLPNNATVYAVRAAESAAFLADVMETSPTFLNTVLGCFMVDVSLVRVRATHRLAGHDLLELAGSERDMGTIALTKDMFGYPERYQRFAKLYTFPYAELEVSDNEGKSVTVRIESTGNVRAHAVTSVAFPYLNMRIFLTGIGGVGSQTYKWVDLAGSHDESISNSDWYKFCYDFDIPMYALYMDGLTSWRVHNENRAFGNARNSALISYHNSARQANNVYANTVAESGTAETNAHASADTQNANVNRSTSTMVTNTANNAATLVSNNANTCAANTDITANNNATLLANTALTNSLNTYTMTLTNLQMDQSTGVANSMSVATTDENNHVTSTVANNDMSGAIGIGGATAAGALAGMALGSVLPGAGNAIGAIGGAVIGGATATASNLISAGFGISNANATVNASEAITGITTRGNLTRTSYQRSNNTNLTERQATNNTKQSTNTTDNNTSNTKRQNECNTANTKNNADTMNTNAANLKATDDANAAATAGTSKSNATRTKNTTQSNGGYTRDAAIAAAQDVLRNAQNGTKALAADARNMNAVQLCPASGNMTSEYMRNRGVQVRVRTQSKSAIRMAGDEFVRHGYALNQIWNVDDSGLCLMRHFTYWKASEVWVYDRCETNDTAQNSISALLKRGVTVWKDPTEIGRVNPYDN